MTPNQEPVISILPDPAQSAVAAPPSPSPGDGARKQHAEIGMVLGSLLWAGPTQEVASMYAAGARAGWTPDRIGLLIDVLERSEAGCRSWADSARLLRHVLSDPSLPAPLDDRAAPNETPSIATPA